MADDGNVVSETVQIKADAATFIQEVQAASNLLQLSFFNAFSKIALAGGASIKVIEEALVQLDPTKIGGMKQITASTKEAEVAAQNYLKTINLVREASLSLSKTRGITPLAAFHLPLITNTFNPGQVSAAMQQLNKNGVDVNNTLTKQNGIVTTLATALGFTLANAIQSIIRLFQQAFQVALDFTKGLFRLEVGVRALQRTGMVITIKEMRDEISKLKEEFGTFSEKELVLGAVNFGNLISGMGFTKDQMFELMRASTTLAVVNGRNMEDVQRTMALALASGYTEGLQRLGVSINRVTIATKAGQMGYADNYMSLTEVQRAQATYALVLEKTAKYQQDINAYQESYIGQIDAAKAKMIDLAATAGGPLVSMLGALAKVLVYVADAWIGIIALFKQGMSIVGGIELAFMGTANAILRTGKVLEILKMFPQTLKASYAEAKKIWGLGTSLGDVSVENANPLAEQEQAAEEASDAIVTKIDDIVQESKEDIAKIYEDYYNEIADLEKEYADKVVKENIDYARKLADLQTNANRQAQERARDHARKLVDISADEQRDIAKETRDYANDLTNIDIEYQQDVEKAKRKFRQDQIDKEAQFQEKMLKLRENFLFDLEESIRKGDAKSARQAARKYVLDRTQAIRDHALDRRGDARTLQDELDNLARDREIQKQERAIAFAQKMADIARQAEIERADEAIRYQQQQADDALRYAQERADAALRHSQEMADLAKWLAAERKAKADNLAKELADQQKAVNTKLAKLAKSFVDEYNLTAAGLNRLYQLLYAYYGPGGLITRLKEAGAASGGGSGPVPGGNGGGYYVPGQGYGAGEYAEGGSFIASRPVSALFGEGGAELVTATPLNKMGKNVGKLFGSVPAGTNLGGGGKGKLTIEVLASKDFEVRILDQTLGQLGDVLVASRRARNGV